MPALSELLLAVLPESPPVALQVLQGGIFHGLSASLHVRLSGHPSPQAVRKALAENPQIEIAAKPRHLGPIDSGQSDKVIVGAVRTDPVGGYWLWAVVDNLTRESNQARQAMITQEISEIVSGANALAE